MLYLQCQCLSKGYTSFHQSTASQSEKDIRRLTTQLANLQQQLRQTDTAKEAAEKEQNVALSEREKTKVRFNTLLLVYC